jgi:hypothetical protein
LFTLYLLRADPPANTRQAILTFQYPYCFRHIPIPYSLDKIGNIYIDGTTIDTIALGTLDAAACLNFSLLSTIAQSNFIKILAP